jgi:crotonobetainyl-CoA:carnitine CoA-transferase CaiB-like acyl-CoA transferase
MPALCVADMAGAQEAVITALSMLLTKSNMGTYREISLCDSAKYFSQTIHFKLSGPKSVLNGKNPRYRLYEAARGFIALASLEEHYWRRLCEGLGLNNPGAAELELAFKKKTAAEWEILARKLDIPLMEVKEDVWR